MKLAINADLDPQYPSGALLEWMAKNPDQFFVDEQHSAIGEQLGVKRAWYVSELGEGEVVGLCDKAWSRIGNVVVAAHELAGAKYEAPPEDAHDVDKANLLLETDVDPTLPAKWGWL